MPYRISAVIGGLGLFLVVLGVTGAAAAFNGKAAFGWISIAAAGAIAFIWSVVYRRPKTPPDSEG